LPGGTDAGSGALGHIDAFVGDAVHLEVLGFDRWEQSLLGR
jgi:hypothetical protein